MDRAIIGLGLFYPLFAWAIIPLMMCFYLRLRNN